MMNCRFRTYAEMTGIGRSFGKRRRDNTFGYRGDESTAGMKTHGDSLKVRDLGAQPPDQNSQGYVFGVHPT